MQERAPGTARAAELARKALRGIDVYLVRWAMRKYKRLRGHRKRAWKFLAGVFAREPELFAHWKVVRADDRTVGAV